MTNDGLFLGEFVLDFNHEWLKTFSNYKEVGNFITNILNVRHVEEIDNDPIDILVYKQDGKGVNFYKLYAKHVIY